MTIDATQVMDEIEVDTTEWFAIQYPISAYTFPSDVRIHQVQLDETHLHVELVDGRNLAIPLWWIPTLHNAPSAEREKYTINRSRTMLIWDPRVGAINETMRIADYLGPVVPA